MNFIWNIPKERPQRVRIFESNFLEKRTFVHPLTPFIFWIPIIAYGFYLQGQMAALTPQNWALLVLSGILSWTFAEYWIHRVIFHLDLKSDWGKRFIYIVHGNHHDDPADPWRGVMPITAAIIYVAIIYLAFALILPIGLLHGFMAAFLVGYLLYDGIHFYTHHGRPQGPIGKFLRRSHLIHHTHHDKRYGISSPLWDFVFRTL